MSSSDAERLAIERAAELDAIKTALADPNAVWVNMLRGTIATPQAIRAGEEELGRHREELEQIKTAMGCQGMNLADVLKVVEVLKGETVQEAMEKKPVRCDHCNGMGGRMTWDGVNDPESEPCVICNGTGYMQ